MVQFSFSTSPKISASRHKVVILWGRICAGRRGRRMLWDETRPKGADDTGGCPYEGSWIAPCWAGAYDSSCPQRSSLSLEKLFEPSFCGWTPMVCSSLYRLVSSKPWRGSCSPKPRSCNFYIEVWTLHPEEVWLEVGWAVPTSWAGSVKHCHVTTGLCLSS